MLFPENIQQLDRNQPSRKKPMFSIIPKLRAYLKEHGREVKIPIDYKDLLNFTWSTPVLDRFGKNTYWESVSYDMREWEYLRDGLVQAYAVLKTEGDFSFVNHLDVARIDYCAFGNSHPFRIRIVNKFNDNYDHYYVKVADGSRIYGLELEHLLSPNRITFLTHGNTLVEEHIAGIPGDIFIEKYLKDSTTNKIRVAKELVKFNERCFVKLLGDMRSYNFVVNLTPDIEDYQYRIRAIDFDQQSYEGKLNLYKPQFFKENYPLVEMTLGLLNADSIKQYQAEERTMMAFRVAGSRYRLMALLDIMGIDNVSTDRKVQQLSTELSDLTGNAAYLKCRNMGQVVKTHLKNMLRKSLIVVPRVTSRYAD
ncbi:MAG: hypothetical protein EAY75_17665 [Bacteroidetes bacterium]|nr:MAG: hypothetical protein EAY75_17665 [Bacteroidota bacterium]